MNDLTTVREALTAQALGEIVVLVDRVEALPGLLTKAENSLQATIDQSREDIQDDIDQASERLKSMVQALDDAGERYRGVITEFNQHAKTEVTEHLKRRGAEITTDTLSTINVAMQTAASTAFRSEASDKATALGIALGQAAKDFSAGRRARLLETVVVCISSSMLTAAVVIYLIR